MSSLETRKTRLTFETANTVRERGRSRQVVIEAQPYVAFVRLKGTRTTFPIAWDAIYCLAARNAAERARAEKRAVKKAGASRG